MTNSIKQLQKEKENKIRAMRMEEIKHFIETNVAYYYSHYMDYSNVNTLSKVDFDERMIDAKFFQKSFNENLDLIINNIKSSYSEPNLKRARIFQILAMLFQNINDNLILNHDKETKYFQKMFDGLQNNFDFQKDVTGLITGFTIHVNSAYNQFIQCKKMLLAMYELVALYEVNDIIFNVVNNTFKSMFIEFYMDYVSAKHCNIEDILKLTDDSSVDSLIDSDEMKIFYNDSVERLNELDEMFDEVIKDYDLFSFPKQYLKDSLESDVVYDLKQFDIDYPISDDNIIGSLLDDDSYVSDEFKELEKLEKKYNVNILFENNTDDTVFDEPVIADADINDGNIDELEEMLL